MHRLAPFALIALILSLTMVLSVRSVAMPQMETSRTLPERVYSDSAGMDSWYSRSANENAPEQTVVIGWHQEAHDAQHTGYSPVDVPMPWEFLWQWNGSCDSPMGSDCRPGDPEEGWTFEVPAKSHLVAGGGRLYLPVGEHGVWALRESDGGTAWHNSGIESYCTAAYDPEMRVVFVAGSNGWLYKLDASDGRMIDSFEADSGLNLAPIIAGDRVYVVSDNGMLYAVDKSTMSQDWVYVAGSAGQTPAAYSEAYDVLVFGSEDLYVHGVNNEDGSQRWREKPTVNVPGDLSYVGGDGRQYRTYNYEHGWPVVAGEHGVVLVRLRLPKSAMWGVPDQNTANWFANSNEAIRVFLTSRPELQTLFALDLDDGSRAFIPAVGTGGLETPDKDNTLGPPPVVKRFANGDEVVYTIWRNGQKCEAGDCSDPRWDAVMGEMMLDDTTVSGYQAGDCRFVRFRSPRDHLITDEMGKVSMAGDTLFHSHWVALYSYRITDRSSGRGATYEDPIETEQLHSIVNRVSNELGWVECQPDSSHFCSGQIDTYGDQRTFDGGYWAFFNTCDPPYQCCTGYDCVAAYSDGYKPRYAIVNNGTIYYELNGGTVLAVRSEGSSGPLADVDKQVEPASVSMGETITYTISVMGNGSPLTMIDSLPAGLSAPGPIVSTIGEGTYDSDRRQVIWNGTPEVEQWVSIRFTTTVQVNGPVVLVNIAELTDTQGHSSSDTADVLVGNLRRLYLPSILASNTRTGTILGFGG